MDEPNDRREDATEIGPGLWSLEQSPAEDWFDASNPETAAKSEDPAQ